jgi:chorismate mutase
MSHPESRLLAVRGATTLPEDHAEILDIEVSRLLEALVTENKIQAEDIVSVFFTLTPDIHSASPAKTARRLLAWEHVALFSAIEPDIVGQPQKAIRILIQFYGNVSQSRLRHIYLNDARHLRPDRAIF